MTGTAHIGRVGTLAVALGIGLVVAGPTGLAWADPEASGSGASTAGRSAGSADGGDTESAGSRGPRTGSAQSAAGTEPADSDNHISQSTDTDEAAGSADDGPDSSRPHARKTRSWPRARLTSTVPTRRLRQVIEESAEPSDGTHANSGTPGPTAMTSPAVDAVPAAVVSPVGVPVATLTEAPTEAKSPRVHPIVAKVASASVVLPAPASTPADSPGKPGAALTMLALASTPRRDSKAVAAAVLPTYSISSVPVGAEPAGVALSVDGTRAYVANSAGKSVSVVNTATGAVLATVPVAGSASAVALSPTGSRAYVTLKSASKVAVIDTVTNKVVASVAVGLSPTSVALSPNGSRVYVTNTGGGTVSVIDTATNTRIANVSVGLSPTGITMSRDGTRLYMALKGSDQVAVFNPVNNSVITRVKVGSSPRDVAVAPTGTQLYVANGAGSVSVIDTVTNRVIGSAIPVGPAPTSLAFSSGGSQVFVANGNDTVSVIDTATSAVVQAFSIDAVPESGEHDIAVSANGTRLYVTDQRDGMLRVVSVAPANNAPTLTAGPTIGDPSGTDATVSVSFTVGDVDGDPLNSTVSVQPTQGSVTVTAVTTTYNTEYTYLYTPTAAARDQAAQTSGEDTDTFTVKVSDGKADVFVPVRVAILPAAPTYGVTTVSAGSGPSGAVVTNGFVYVPNYGSGDVTVVDAATNHAVKTLTTGRGPLSIAASDQRKRVYVANSLDNTVSVIDAGTNNVIRTVTLNIPRTQVDNPEAGTMFYDNMITELAVTPDGSRLYVAATDGSVTVVNTAGDINQILQTASLGRMNDLKISADGRWLYGTPGVGLSIIDTSTMAAVGVQVGPVWNHDVMRSAFTDSTGNIAVSPDGKRVYVSASATTVETGTGGHTSGSFITDASGVTWWVSGQYGFVSVIDTDPASATYRKEIATVNIPNWAQDLTVSGSTLYVTNWDGMTVSAVDTATNTLLTNVVTDQTRSGGRGLSVDLYYEWDPETRYPYFSVAAYGRYIAAGPTGTAYVTDYYDGAVYVVSRNALAV